MIRPLVITHSPCADGFTAAWVIRKKFPDAEFVPGIYRKPPPQVEGRDVLVVDFSFDRQTTIELQQKSKSFMLIDHHKGAQEDLGDLPYCFFDMNRSGAGLAWDFMFPGEPRPWLVNYVEDRDIWIWKQPKSKEVSAALDSYEYTFETWDAIAQRNPEELAIEGAALVKYRDALIQKVLKENVREVEFEGYKILAANCPLLHSELGHELAKGRPFSIVWRQRSDGRFVYSLRSEDGGLDVSVLAKKHGGGGHAQASGFDTTNFLF